MKCDGCGASLPKEAVYCYACGRRVRRRGGLLKIIAPLLAAVVLAVQLNATLAAMMGNKPVNALFLEAGHIYYREGDVTFAVVGPDPLYVESVAKLAEKGSGRFGYSTCYLHGEGFRPPPSLGVSTHTGRRLASAVEEVWMAGMGRAKAVDTLYNGTHAVITLTVDGLDYLAITSALSRASADVCVRVLIG